MRSVSVALLVAGVILVGAGAVYALSEKSVGGATTLSGGSGCPGNSLAIEGQPRGDPASTIIHSLKNGESFVLEQPPGQWVAILRGDGIEFADLSPHAREDWYPNYTHGWCRGHGFTQDFVVRGEGTVSITVYNGAAGGLVVR